MALKFAIEEINRRADILPNITLGYMVYNTRGIERGSMAGVMSISYGATDVTFTDRRRFPYIYRTVPNEGYFYQALIQLLKHFGWTWVGILIADNEAEYIKRQLIELITSNGMCVEFAYGFLWDGRFDDRIVHRILRTTSKVVIISDSTNLFWPILRQVKIASSFKRTWIFSVSSSFTDYILEYEIAEFFAGSLAFPVAAREMDGFQDFLFSANPDRYPEDIFIQDAWLGFVSDLSTEMTDSETYVSNITGSEDFLNASSLGNETLASIPHYRQLDLRVPYSVYKALNHLLRKVHVTLSSSQEEIYINKEGEAPGQYDLTNWVMFPDRRTNELNVITVGRYNTLNPNQLICNDRAIVWYPNDTEIPISMCSDSCIPGYRKNSREVEFSCCYDCVPCAEGHISNTTDMETCIQCPEDQWPNDNRTICIQKITEFLSYEDPLGQSLAAVSVLSSLTVISVLLIFIKYHKTPVVKANNQTLSYSLLLSLTLSFLCCFLFIGRPQKVTCLLRQVTFGINFTLSVSCVLAKTVTVAIAFNATKPGSKIKKWVGTRVSLCLVLLCSLLQVGICLVWLISSPPFPDYDTHTYTGTMILQCNEGSVSAFYTVIGYMGFLSGLSFIVAFLVRKLPASFNEAQLITFSMLVFCSVWVSFIPAYLSTKGKYMVAVEIFAILASSAGLLGCIFIPKCYIILFRPEQNTRRGLTGKRLQ
uniref:G-protein coupled receptors family 3 profile domain-containing protein n=1 Tax=Xenopus tropicalis TaxID=8364 RepID=A0A1B8Y5T1_XENTR